MALNLKHHNSCNSRLQFKTRHVNLRPSDDDLAECQALYYAIDMIITTRLNNCDEILFGRSKGIRFWSWAVITIDNHKIPAPIYTTTKTLGVLYNFSNRAIEMSQQECAYVTAIYYLDMIKQMAREWDIIVTLINPLVACNIEPAIRWILALPDDEYASIIRYARDKLTVNGLQVLD